ncbi:MAG: FtsX-like permease family protein [Pseudomonadota bacterium]
MLSLAWRNLWRHSRRTWLTVGAMIFSNILLVFMITLQIGNYGMMIENSLKAYAGHIQISATGYSDEPKLRLTVDNITELAELLRREIPELSVSMRGETFVMASSEERSFGLQVAGVDVAHEATVSSIPGLLAEGQYLRAGDHPEIVIGSVLARNLKVGVGDEITLLGSGYDGSFAAAVVNVRGIFNSGIAELDRNLAQISFASFQALFAMQEKGHVVIANSSDVYQAASYQQQIQQLLNQQSELGSGAIEVLNWRETNPSLVQAIQSDLVSSIFMYMVLIVLVSFSVLNTQLMSVLERTREFGIMTAIGLRPGQLGKLVVLETTAMAGLGLVIGAFLGLCLTIYLNQVGFVIPGMEEMAARYNLQERLYPSISVFSILVGPSVVFLGCLLAAVYPVIRLQGLQPVAAMRAA